MSNPLRTLFGVLCALILTTSFAWGQAGTGSVRGEITDPQAKQVAGAIVTIKSDSTGLVRTQVTEAGGAFSFELMPPGDYVLTVEAAGFKRAVKNVTAQVGSATDASVRLEIGTVGETVQVEVTGGTIAVNTQDATLGNTFENRQISQLPMEARDIRSLLTLQPGVTYNVDPNSTTGGAVNGARPDQSNLTLDGIDINEAQTSRLNDPVLRLNSEAVEEFRVTTLNANANQGRSSAAQVNLITKAGSNNLHGAAFFFNRSTGFTSNNFFNNRTIDPLTGKRLPTPALIRDTFGGAIGGPIAKDRLFFFYSYEGRRDSSADSVVRVVPLPTMGLGQLRVQAQKCADPSRPATCDSIQTVTLTSDQLNNNVFPAVKLNPAALAILADAAKKYPANDFTVGDSNSSVLLNTAGYRFNYPVQRKLNSSVIKFDTNITRKQTAFFPF